MNIKKETKMCITIVLSFVLLLSCGARQTTFEQEIITPQEKKVKTMVRFSKNGLYNAMHNELIKILNIDSIQGVQDTSYYIDYIKKDSL